MASLQKQYEQMNEKYIKAKALKENAMKQMKKEFNCETIEEAEDYLRKMEDEIEQKEAKIKSQFAKFKSQYGHLAVDGEED